MFKDANVDLNRVGEKTKVPDLPTSEKDLAKWSLQNLQVVYESDAVSEFGGTYRPGGIAVSSLVLRCPFCKMIFFGSSRSGCFGGSMSPPNCPNCAFPHNVIEAYTKLVVEKRNGSAKKKTARRSRGRVKPS